jgi:hypothetical protein
LIRGVGRFIRQQQQQRVVELGETHAIPFNIFMDARYHHVKVASDEVTLQASTANLDKLIKCFYGLSIEEE